MEHCRGWIKNKKRSPTSRASFTLYLFYFTNTDHYYAVWWYVGRKFIFINAQVFLSPKIANNTGSLNAKVTPFYRKLSRNTICYIEQSGCLASICQVFCQCPAGICFRNNGCLFAQRVLVDCKHFI